MCTEEESVIECRICHSKSTQDLIQSPCFCKGSLAFVHFKCLERWLNTSSRRSCELCSYHFNVIMSRRFTFLQSIRIWFQQPAARTFLLMDFIILFILLILNVLLVLLTLFGRNHFVEEALAQGTDTFWSEAILDCLLIILLLAYLTAVYMMAQDHIRPWYTWWIHCNNVKLIRAEENVQLSPPVPNQITNNDSERNSQNLSEICKHFPDETNTQYENKSEVLIGSRRIINDVHIENDQISNETNPLVVVLPTSQRNCDNN